MCTKYLPAGGGNELRGKGPCLQIYICRIECGKESHDILNKEGSIEGSNNYIMGPCDIESLQHSLLRLQIPKESGRN